MDRVLVGLQEFMRSNWREEKQGRSGLDCRGDEKKEIVGEMRELGFLDDKDEIWCCVFSYIYGEGEREKERERGLREEAYAYAYAYAYGNGKFWYKRQRFG